MMSDDPYYWQRRAVHAERREARTRSEAMQALGALVILALCLGASMVAHACNDSRRASCRLSPSSLVEADHAR
jgi:hypothetical protein